MKQTTMSGPSRGQGADMKFPSEILELLSRTSLQFTLNKFKKIFSAHKITDPPGNHGRGTRGADEIAVLDEPIALPHGIRGLEQRCTNHPP
jgi:hypothetical protein